VEVVVVEVELELELEVEEAEEWAAAPPFSSHSTSGGISTLTRSEAYSPPSSPSKDTTTAVTPARSAAA
jgi:hypothetical protein